jgi:hypothetical protein
MQNIFGLLFSLQFPCATPSGQNMTKKIASLTSIPSHCALNANGNVNLTFSGSLSGKVVRISSAISPPVVSINIDVIYEGSDNNYTFIDCKTNFVHRDSDTLARGIGDMHTLNGAFAICSRLCVPVNHKNEPGPSSVQSLIHGGTLHRTFLELRAGLQLCRCSCHKGVVLRFHTADAKV